MFETVDDRRLYLPLGFGPPIGKLKPAPDDSIRIWQKGEEYFAEVVKPDGVLFGSAQPDRMTIALKRAVTAANEAEKHAKQLGLDLEFTPGDVRALAISAFIASEPVRGRKGSY